MACGGGDGRRLLLSEPRNRLSAFSRLTNMDDERASSGVRGTTAHEDRLNNWDFLDWKPSSAFNQTKRPKRGNEEKQDLRRSGKANIATSDDSSPRAEPKKHRTPSTFPRTKVTSTTSQLERQALENLRQQLTFSDADEQMSTDGMDGERNNERYMPHRQYPVHMSLERNDTFNRRTEPSRDNRNAPNNLLLAESDDNPDSTQIVGRLMQIRDYIKQAASMLDKLQSSADSSDQHRASQLQQVISRLREQEQKYLELLLRMSTAQEEDLLRQTHVPTQNGGVNSQLESESEATELDMGASEESSENEQEPLATGNRRPLIEDHLGRHSDTEPEEVTVRRVTSDLENTLVAEPSPLAADRLPERHSLECDLDSKNSELVALKQQHDLLSKMLEQQEQLRALQSRQSQLMMLQREAEQKLSHEQDKDGTMSSNSSVSNNMDVPALDDSAQAVACVAHVPALDSEADALPQELLELRQRLDFLKNLYDIDDDDQEHRKPTEEQTSQQAQSDEGSVAPSSLLSMDKTQLQLRLGELQNKKHEMDSLLNELNDMTCGVLDAAETESNVSSSQARVDASIAATAMANSTQVEAQDVIEMLEARNKMKKLQDVRDRLDQLKSLVRYYQTGAEFIHGDSDQVPTAATPLYEQQPAPRADTLDASFLHNLRSHTQASVREILVNALGEQTAAQVLHNSASGDVTTRSDTSEATSQLSSTLGAWGEDPQIQEKVRRLKEAKEKLHRLQDLVAMVQDSPEVAQHLPDDLDALASSMQPNVLAQGDGLSLRDAVGSLAEGDGAFDQAEAYYEHKVGHQRSEIERLVSERQKLLALQQELERLHEDMPNRNPGRNIGHREIAQQTSPHVRVPTVDIAVETHNMQDYRIEPSPNNGDLAGAQIARMQHSPNNRELARRQTGTAQQQAKAPEQIGVTFQEPLETVISNEELYGRMRQQRMLREELREKKKELEDMMRKDKPKKQNFSRNQDNHSDNVSFSNRSDPFTDRASQDQTAATWGGSTADNLESIEEDAGDSRDGHQAEQVDDGYPSDGIVQVEEEEEEANENDSDDRDTYTIEEDRYPSKMRATTRHVVPPDVTTNSSRRRSRQSPTRGAPFQGSTAPGYNYWAPDNNQVLNNVRSNRIRDRSRKKSEINTLRQELDSLKEQLSSVQETMQNPQPAVSAGQAEPGPLYNNLQYMASLQQQQMFLSLSQFQSQMGQQQELAERLARIERSMSDSCYGSTDVLDARHRGAPPQEPLQPAAPRATAPRATAPPTCSPAGMPHYLDSYSALYRSAAAAETAAPFQLQPNFPRGFAGPVTGSDVEQSPIGYRQLRRNINNNQSDLSDAQRLDAILQQEDASDRRANPYRIPEYLLRGSGVGYPDPEHVPIETIQANDLSDNNHASNIPRLHLGATARQTAKRSEDRSEQYQGARPKQRSHVRDTSRRDARHAETLVIGRRVATASRAEAAARLASQRVDLGRDYRPGLSAGISGAGYRDNVSVSSAVSSVPGGEEPIVAPPPGSDGCTAASNYTQFAREVEASGEYSLFETLRETIYSEVATLISQNEGRPHYLIEMFRELQLLSTDYLRQRLLYCVHDLVNKYLTEENVQQHPPDASAAGQVTPSGLVTSEMTPSVSLSTLDEEEIKAKIFGARKLQQATQSDPYQRDPYRAAMPGGATMHRAHGTTRYDFMEPVETLSSISTPESNHYESPFAQDSLGDTVIHLDKALQRMKDYEERLAHSGTQTTPHQPPPAVIAQARTRSTQTGAAAHPRTSSRDSSQLTLDPRTSSRDTSQLTGAGEEEQSSSAMDNGSEESLSDIGESTSSSSAEERTYPRIDTQQLDQQIKSIMTEIIPVLKEHMDDVCSQQLLLYIKRLVLSLTRQRDDEGQEFVRFFHKQLGSILQDSLAKFEGRKMRDCGEDLLVDLSEILFNELAFFRLMQDLDDPKAKVKANLRNWHHTSQASSDTARNEEEEEEEEEDEERADTVRENYPRPQLPTSSEEASESSECDSDREQVTGASSQVTGGSSQVTGGSSQVTGGGSHVTGSGSQKQDIERKQELLAANGSDEEMVENAEEEYLGNERDDELAAQINIAADDLTSSMKITLAPSETKPMTRIGSDEDDEGDDAEFSNEDPSDTAVSHDYYCYNDDMCARETSTDNLTPAATAQQASSADDGATHSEHALPRPHDVTTSPNVKELEAHENEKDADTKEATSGGENTTSESAPSNGQVVENGHGDEMGEVTIDDLPETLTLPQVASKSVESSEALATQDVLEYVNSTISTELAGDASAIKQPETVVESPNSSRNV